MQSTGHGPTRRGLGRYEGTRLRYGFRVGVRVLVDL